MSAEEIQYNNSNIKRIFINDKLTNITNTDTHKIMVNTTTNKTKQIIKKEKEKEKKMRVETHTWGLNNEDLSFDTQLSLLKSIYNPNASEKCHSENIGLIISHIKSKISSYKQQDILKNRFNDQEFVSYIDVIELLDGSNMKCHYCACETYLLYEIVRENKQWSLDRINNDIGHNKNNLLIACLECNLKRRRTNKDAFLFTKNLKIIRLD